MVKGRINPKRVAIVLVGVAVLLVAAVLLVEPGSIEQAKRRTEVWLVVLYVVLANILTVLLGVAVYWLWRWIRGGRTAPPLTGG